MVRTPYVKTLFARTLFVRTLRTRTMFSKALLPATLAGAALGVGWLSGCHPALPSAHAQPPAATAPATKSPEHLEKPGLHNVYRITDWLISGSSPEGAEGFRSLRELGIKTVISVDGTRPDVASAKEQGLRYVHIPIGYEGIPREKVLQLAKACQDLPRPIYLHCHHGKHRGPAAAAAVHICLDDRCTVNQALTEMKTFGTDPKYRGLFEAIKRLERPTAKQLAAVPTDFPETAQVASFVERMVEIDTTWDHLKEIKAAGWKVPAKHPDLDPAQEALQLLEHYREAARLPEHAQRPAAFQEFLKAAETEATELEKVLQAAGQKPLNAATLDPLFKRSEAACAKCHSQFRDVRP